MADATRNKSVEMKKGENSKTTDIGERFAVKMQVQQPSQPSQHNLAKTDQGFGAFNYSSVKNVPKVAGEANGEHHSSSPFANIKLREQQQIR